MSGFFLNAPKPWIAITPSEHPYWWHRHPKAAKAEAQRLALKKDDVFTVYQAFEYFVKGRQVLKYPRYWIVIAESRNNHAACRRHGELLELGQKLSEELGEAVTTFGAIAKYKSPSFYPTVSADIAEMLPQDVAVAS